MLNARGSSGLIGAWPRSTCTLHLRHVPWPPHVESMAMPFQLAASKIGVPLGTRTSVAVGQEAQQHALGAVDGAPARPSGSSSRASCGRGLTTRAAAFAASRSRCSAIQRAPHSSWPSSRSAARTE